MVSAGVCVGGKGRLHFVDEKAKVNAAYYLDKLWPKLVEDCEQLLPNGFVFQQDGAPAHTARVTQDWLKTNCRDFIALLMSGRLFHPTLIRSIIMFGGQCWSRTTSCNQNQKLFVN